MVDQGDGITIAVFALVYLAMVVGHLPGFRVDRASAALLGAVVLVVSGQIELPAAWDAVDAGTLALLFGLMVVSGAFVLSGFYGWVGTRMAAVDAGPPALLAMFVGVGGILSALLNRDVVVVAMVPLLVRTTLQRGLNPVPFLLGFCFAANTAGSATLIGSPANMIIADSLGLSFQRYLALAGPPALLSLPIVWGIVALLYRGGWTLAAAPAPSPEPGAIVLDRGATAKAAAVGIAVLAAFWFTEISPRIIALAAAALLLLSRRFASSEILGRVDGGVLLLLFGLFIVNSAFEATGLPRRWIGELQGMGIDLGDPLILLFAVAAISDVIGNSPTVMLLIPHLAADDRELVGAALSLGTGFSGSAVIIGSLAGMILADEAGRQGIRLSFWEFSRAGIPVALACLLLAALWLLWLS